MGTFANGGKYYGLGSKNGMYAPESGPLEAAKKVFGGPGNPDDVTAPFRSLLGSVPKDDQTDVFLKALNGFGQTGQGRKAAFSGGASDGLALPSVGSKSILGG